MCRVSVRGTTRLVNASTRAVSWPNSAPIHIFTPRADHNLSLTFQQHSREHLELECVGGAATHAVEARTDRTPLFPVWSSLDHFRSLFVGDSGLYFPTWVV